MPLWQEFRDHAGIRWTWQAELRCVGVVLDCLKEKVVMREIPQS